MDNYKKVIYEVLMPVINTNKDEVNELIENDPEFKCRVEEKVNKKLEARNSIT